MATAIKPIGELTADQRSEVFNLLLASQRYQREELDHAIIDEARFDDDWRVTFQRSQADPNEEQFIYLVDHLPKGYIRVRLNRQPEKNGGYIDDLFVDPSHRRQGVAQRLIEAGSDWLRGREAAELHLSVARTNPQAIAVYEAIGFKQQPSEYLDYKKKLSEIS